MAHYQRASLLHFLSGFLKVPTSRVRVVEEVLLPSDFSNIHNCLDCPTLIPLSNQPALKNDSKAIGTSVPSGNSAEGGAEGADVARGGATG